MSDSLSRHPNDGPSGRHNAPVSDPLALSIAAQVRSVLPHAARDAAPKARPGRGPRRKAPEPWEFTEDQRPPR